VPAIFHFFIHFYYFHLRMFERFINYIVPFHIVCRLRYTASGAHPVCILVCILCVSRHSSGVHSTCSPFYHLRYYLTFGRILPRIIEQVLCLRYSTFYPFLLLSFIDVREIYDLHCILLYCVSFTIHCILRASGAHPFCILVSILCVCPVYVLSISDIHPACTRRAVLSIIFGLILPSV
jgi:hypothetical protein